MVYLFIFAHPFLICTLIWAYIVNYSSQQVKNFEDFLYSDSQRMCQITLDEGHIANLSDITFEQLL